MKIKKGYKWKSIEGMSKGEWFIVTGVYMDKFECRKLHGNTSMTYTYPREYFEQYIQRVNSYWREKNKSYKNKKQKLREAE